MLTIKLRQDAEGTDVQWRIQMIGEVADEGIGDFAAFAAAERVRQEIVLRGVEKAGNLGGVSLREGQQVLR